MQETLSAVDYPETPGCLRSWGFYSLKVLHGKKRSEKYTHTLGNPMDCSMPGFLVLHQLLEFAQTHVNCVSDGISSAVNPLSSCLQISGSFLMSLLFASSGQSIGASASASVLPMNIQDWFPLKFTGLISLLSKGLSRVFSNTTVWKHQFFGAHSGNWWWTGRPGMLQFMGSQRVGHDWVTELNWTELLYGPTLTSIHDYWKNSSFDYMDLCPYRDGQRDVSAFEYTI